MVVLVRRRLCHDIRLVRQYKEFGLEVDLYGQLVFVYRSSDAMVKLTALPPPPPSSAVDQPEETSTATDS